MSELKAGARFAEWQGCVLDWSQPLVKQMVLLPQMLRLENAELPLLQLAWGCKVSLGVSYSW